LADRIKAMARGGAAIEANTGWTVNGSAAEGRKMINEYTKLMLRAYNAEADNCVARLGKTMGIRVAPDRKPSNGEPAARVTSNISKNQRYRHDAVPEEQCRG
jgi:ATP-dependent phosphoenolpyruvate carboxykinase